MVSARLLMVDLYLARRGLKWVGLLNVMGEMRGHDINVMTLQQGQGACNMPSRGINLTNIGLGRIVRWLRRGKEATSLYQPRLVL
jgi:hypothetical protein